MKFVALNLLNGNDWVTIIFLLILALLGFVKYTYKGRLVELVAVFFSNRYFLHYGKESQLVLNQFNVIMFFVQTLVLSLYFFLAIQFYNPNFIVGIGLILFLKICGGLVLFFMFKLLLGYVFGVLFELKKQYSQVVFVKRTYLFSIAVISFPVLLLVFYVKNYNLLLFQLSFLLLSTLLIVRYLFVLKSNKSIILKDLFYFILYLCALEIAPLVLIFKIIN